MIEKIWKKNQPLNAIESTTIHIYKLKGRKENGLR